MYRTMMVFLIIVEAVTDKQGEFKLSKNAMKSK